MICFYHDDMDGCCSAAIVNRHYSDKIPDEDIVSKDFVCMNYSKEIDLSVIMPDELVIIVDFSFSIDDFILLLDITDKIIWIDHHKTALEKDGVLKGMGINLLGTRDVSNSASLLSWNYFFQAEELPMPVAFVDDYDTWRFKYGDLTRHFIEGAKLSDYFPKSEVWNVWLQDIYSGTMNDGRVCSFYREKELELLNKRYSFPIIFEGYKCVACNAGNANSSLFDGSDWDVDIKITFVFDGKNWVVSLYTNDPDIDVSEIAKKYGGGGHKSASGFVMKNFPFEVKYEAKRNSS